MVDISQKDYSFRTAHARYSNNLNLLQTDCSFFTRTVIKFPEHVFQRLNEPYDSNETWNTTKGSVISTAIVAGAPITLKSLLGLIFHKARWL